ncbi:MAG: hypothetical protein Q8Q12_00480 [bacterium]|nr:hypothetical protein [bacterium]
MRGKIAMRRRSCVVGAIALVFATFLGGCTLQVVSLQSKGTIMPEQPKPVTLAAAMPWKVGADFLLALIPTMGQTRRLAIQEKVPYIEERSWTLFRIEKSGTTESKVEKQGENYSSEKREQLK